MTPIKKKNKYAVVAESTEGTYAPISAGADFFMPDDKVEIKPSRELLDRKAMTGSLGKLTPRLGLKSVEASLAFELKTSGVAGQSPETSLFLEAALGSKKVISTQTTSKSSGNTASIIQIQDADISKFAKNDVVLVKQAGANHVSPIIAVVSTSGSASIELLIPHPAGDIDDSVVIEKAVIFKNAEEGHKTLSLTEVQNQQKAIKLIGGRVSKVEITNWAVGQLPQGKVSITGLDYQEEIGSFTTVPAFTIGLPPVVKSSKMFKNSTEIKINDFSFNLENKIGYKTENASENGKVNSFITERAIGGSFTIYQDSSSSQTYTNYELGEEFSLFSYLANPTGVAGEIKDVIAVYLPNCMITDMPSADKDEAMTYNLSFAVSKGNDNSKDEITLSYI